MKTTQRLQMLLMRFVNVLKPSESTYLWSNASPLRLSQKKIGTKSRILLSATILSVTLSLSLASQISSYTILPQKSMRSLHVLRRNSNLLKSSKRWRLTWKNSRFCYLLTRARLLSSKVMTISTLRLMIRLLLPKPCLVLAICVVSLRLRLVIGKSN